MTSSEAVASTNTAATRFHKPECRKFILYLQCFAASSNHAAVLLQTRLTGPDGKGVHRQKEMPGVAVNQLPAY